MLRTMAAPMRSTGIETTRTAVSTRVLIAGNRERMSHPPLGKAVKGLAILLKFPPGRHALSSDPTSRQDDEMMPMAFRFAALRRICAIS